MDRKELLIKNALHEFNENGYVAASISKIAKQSGISKATFFHYFKSKEDLADQVFLHCKKVFLYAWEQNHTCLFYHLSEDEIMEMFQYNYEHKEELQFIHDAEYSSYIREEIKQEGAALHQESREELARAQAEHRIIDLDVTFLYMFINNAVLRNLDKIFVNGEIDRAYAMNVVHFIQNALEIHS